MTTETAETCSDCWHPAHPLATCHEHTGGDPSNGPNYCPCTAEMEAMEREIVRLRGTAGIDVRRVKQAVVNVAGRHGVANDPPIPLSVARIFGYSAAPADMDAEIAAEYDRLTARAT